MRAGRLSVLALLVAGGCSGLPVAADLASPTADLSGQAFGYGRAELRVQGRAHYVAPLMGNVDMFGEGMGEGASIVFRSQDSGELQADVLFELALERSSHEEIGGSRSAEYWRALAGFRFVQTGFTITEPYMVVGGSVNQVNISGGEMAGGYGGYVGVGIEVTPYPYFAIGLEATYNHFWNEYLGGGEAASASVAASVGLRF